MREPLDRFGDDVRCRLTRIERRIAQLKEKLSRDRQTTAVSIERDIAGAEAERSRVADDAEAARARMRALLEKRVQTEKRVAEWKRNRELDKLQPRGEDAEAYAAWSMIVADEAIDDVNLAALRAIAAQLDVEEAAGADDARNGSEDVVDEPVTGGGLET